MNVAARTDFGSRSLPAEFHTARGGSFGMRRLWGNQGGMNGMGVGDLTAQDLANLIQQGASATLPLVVASNPGTYLQTNPNTGQVTVYAQPTGNTQNYMGGGMYAGGVGVPGVLGTPTATLGGSVGVGTMLLVAAVGIVALMAMKR